LKTGAEFTGEHSLAIASADSGVLSFA